MILVYIDILILICHKAMYILQIDLIIIIFDM